MYIVQVLCFVCCSLLIASFWFVCAAQLNFSITTKSLFHEFLLLFIKLFCLCTQRCFFSFSFVVFWFCASLLPLLPLLLLRLKNDLRYITKWIWILIILVKFFFITRVYVIQQSCCCCHAQHYLCRRRRRSFAILYVSCLFYHVELLCFFE